MSTSTAIAAFVDSLHGRSPSDALVEYLKAATSIGACEARHGLVSQTDIEHIQHAGQILKVNNPECDLEFLFDNAAAILESIKEMVDRETGRSTPQKQGAAA